MMDSNRKASLDFKARLRRVLDGCTTLKQVTDAYPELKSLIEGIIKPGIDYNDVYESREVIKSKGVL